MMVALAESCTGGMIAAALTDISGSSAVLDRGFVTYSNHAKIDILGVKNTTLDQHGAVSEQTARAMVDGTLNATPLADVALSVTGIAGPMVAAQTNRLDWHFSCQRRGCRKSTPNIYFLATGIWCGYQAVKTALLMIDGR